MNLHRVEPGHYETTDGEYRVVRVEESGPYQWQAQRRALGGWSWITTVGTKRDAVAALNDERVSA